MLVINSDPVAPREDPLEEWSENGWTDNQIHHSYWGDEPKTSMVDLDCQLDGIYNHHGNRSMQGIHIRFIQVRRPTLTMGI